MKICSKCKEEKELSEFYKDKQKKDCLSSKCKTCIDKQVKTYTDKNKETCKIRQKNSSKKYYIKNQSYYKEYGKEYRDSNKEYFEKWREDNREKNREYAKQYFQNNKEKIKHKIKLRRNKNIHLLRWRDLLTTILKYFNKTKIGKTYDLLGYKPIQLKEHLDKLGMKWDIHQIDHKIPISWFIESTPPNVVNDLRNLQPLEAKVNQTKSNKHMDAVDNEYLEIVKPYIKEKYIKIVLQNGK